MSPHRRLTGRGLHTGARCEVRFSRQDGPVCVANARGAARFEDCEVERSDRGVRVYYRRLDLRVELIEHLAAALAGLGIRSGLRIEIEGGEVPLLDGGAGELCENLMALECPRTPAQLEIIRSESVEVGDSRYDFAPTSTQEVAVHAHFPAVGAETATWDGSPGQFVGQFAPARTFGFAADADTLRRAGRAAWIDPAAVLVLDDHGRSMLAGRPRQPSELARHKLLDLLGDLYLLGGPPLGRLVAHRPGHTHNRLAFRRALDSGIVISRSHEEATH